MNIRTLKTNPVAGVYRLVFPDGTSYVGASKDVFRRLQSHTGPDAKLPNNVEAEIICYCRESELSTLEYVFIRLLKPEHNWRNPADNQVLADRKAKFRKKMQEVEAKGSFWASLSQEDREAWRRAGKEQDYQAMRDIAAKYKKPKRPRGRPRKGSTPINP
jgi:hypothetical protein